MILVTLVSFYRVRTSASLLLLPYLLWVSFVMYLNYDIYLRNQEQQFFEDVRLVQEFSSFLLMNEIRCIILSFLVFYYFLHLNEKVEDSLLGYNDHDLLV